jgi:hypothetical protein
MVIDDGDDVEEGRADVLSGRSSVGQASAALNNDGNHVVERKSKNFRERQPEHQSTASAEAGIGQSDDDEVKGSGREWAMGDGRDRLSLVAHEGAAAPGVSMPRSERHYTLAGRGLRRPKEIMQPQL